MNPPDHTEPPALSPRLRRALESIYDELDDALQELGVVCWARGVCCDFERTDHQLYASSLELAYVLEAHPGPLPFSGPLCPFWRDGMCTERRRRPLGCRTYFCDERFRDRLQDLYEGCYARLKRAAADEDFEWSYANFVDALKAARSRPVESP